MIIYRVETLDTCVARVNLSLSPIPTAARTFANLARLSISRSRIRASATACRMPQRADQETSSYASSGGEKAALRIIDPT